MLIAFFILSWIMFGLCLWALQEGPKVTNFEILVVVGSLFGVIWSIVHIFGG